MEMEFVWVVGSNMSLANPDYDTHVYRNRNDAMANAEGRVKNLNLKGQAPWWFGRTPGGVVITLHCLPKDLR